jgi:hypothetical protein
VGFDGGGSGYLQLMIKGLPREAHDGEARPRPPLNERETMNREEMDEIAHDEVGKFLDRQGLRWEGVDGKPGSAVFEVLLLGMTEKIFDRIEGVVRDVDTRASVND